MTPIALLLLLAGPAKAGELVIPDSDNLVISDDAKPLVKDAYAALNARKWDEAAGLFGALADAGAGPDARVLQAVALYEGGSIRETAAALKDVETPAAWNLRGLALVDIGDQAKGVEYLERARASSDPASAARATLNLGLVRLDQGRTSDADGLIRDARARAEKLGDAALVSSCDQAQDALRAHRGESPAPTASSATQLSAVGDAIRRGKLSAAHAELSAMEKNVTSRRDTVNLGLARAAVYRAEGNPERAASTLGEALSVARQSGMEREVAQILASLGLCHAQVGRYDLAWTLFAEAESTAVSGGYNTAAVDYALEAGQIALRLGNVEQAKAKLSTAQTLLASMDHPMGQARAKELAGAIQGETGDWGAAKAALTDAAKFYDERGYCTDAGRASTRLVGLAAWRAPGEVDALKTKALASFSRCGDALGPAHVELSIGIGYARAKNYDAAVRSFGKARDLAAGVGGSYAAIVTRNAEENAAKVLIAGGASDEVAKLAAEQGFANVASLQDKILQGRKAYDAGLSAYGQGRYAEAQKSFTAAVETFMSVGDAENELLARRALVWTRYNVAVSLPIDDSLNLWTAIAAEAQRLGEEELRLRATAAGALASQQKGLLHDTSVLRKTAEEAEKAKMPDVAARCWAGLAEAPGTLTDRAGYARRAFKLAPDSNNAVYAMYSVAVAAYNAGDNALATALAREVLPKAGSLESSVRSVLEAAQK